MNAEEVLSLAETGRADGGGDSEATVWMEDKLASAAAELFGRHGQCLPWIAVTNGGLPCYLFSREFLEDDGTLSSFWRCALFTLLIGVPGGQASLVTFVKLLPREVIQLLIYVHAFSSCLSCRLFVYCTIFSEISDRSIRYKLRTI